MSFGLKIKTNDKGAEINTGLDAQGFALIGMYQIDGASSGSIPLPDYAGFRVHVDELPIGLSNGGGGFTCHTTSVSYTTGDYATGHPIVIYTANPTPSYRNPATMLILFAS